MSRYVEAEKEEEERVLEFIKHVDIQCVYDKLQRYNANQNVIYELLRKYSVNEVYSFIAPSLLENVSFLSEAIKIRHDLYGRLTLKMRNRKTLATIAAGISHSTWPYIPNKMWQNKHVAFAAATYNGIILRYLPEKTLSNPAVVYAAVYSNGLSLEYAPIQYKEDRDIVLTAVTQNGAALQFAADYLKQDRDIVHAAILSNSVALRFTPAFYGDKELVLLSLVGEKVSSEAYYYSLMPYHIKNDQDVRVTAVRAFGAYTMSWIDWDITREDMIVAIKKYGLNWYDLGEFELDVEIMCLAMLHRPHTFWHIEECLMGNYHVLEAACAIQDLDPHIAHVVSAYKVLREQIPRDILLNICLIAATKPE